MFIKRKKNRSGITSIVVAEKCKGNYRELHTIGIAHNEEEAERLVMQGREWIYHKETLRHPRLDLFGEETAKC